MIHLSDPAAYHDKRFKNNPTKRKTMKTPMPSHPEPHTYTWTKLEEEAIREYGRQCVEACAAVCEKQVFTDAAAKKIRAMLTQGETE